MSFWDFERQERQKALADFEEPWVVVVVGGSFMPGDPVEVGAKGGGQERVGKVFKRQQI